MSSFDPGKKKILYVNRKASSRLVAGTKGIFMVEGEEEMSKAKEKNLVKIEQSSSEEDSSSSLHTVPDASADKASVSSTVKSDYAEHRPASGSAGLGGGNVDKIRDIIFGSQMDEYEQRFARLEERMFEEVSMSKSEAKENFDLLEKLINEEVISLKEQITLEKNARNESHKKIERQIEELKESFKEQLISEQNERAESLKHIKRELEDISRSFEQRLDKINEQIDRSSKQLKQQISEQSIDLSNDIKKKYEETESAIKKVDKELRMNKVDRSSLSEFLTEMAVRISKDEG